MPSQINDANLQRCKAFIKWVMMQVLWACMIASGFVLN